MKLRSTLALLAFLASPAMADDMAMGSHASPADKAFMDAMQTMQKHMEMKPTGNADKDFVLMMTPHHQGAIDMAKVELSYGKDPGLRKMATEIIKAQEAEIRAMKDWLAKHGK